jgi:hypothetical protein
MRISVRAYESVLGEREFSMYFLSCVCVRAHLFLCMRAFECACVRLWARVRSSVLMCVCSCTSDGKYFRACACSTCVCVCGTSVCARPAAVRALMRHGGHVRYL